VKLKNDKQVFDKLLLNVNITEIIKDIKLLNKLDFYKEYIRGDDESFRNIVVIITSWKRKFKFNSKIVVPRQFNRYVSNNILAYLILINLNFENIERFLLNEFTNDKFLIKVQKSRIEKYFKLNIMLFFPALHWFLSDKTNHQYPKSLLKKMEKYEKELRKMKESDYLLPPSKWDRLILD